MRKSFLLSAVVLSVLPLGAASAGVVDSPVDFHVVDFHVHLKGGLTLDEAVALSSKRGVTFGIAANCGLGFGITDDKGLEEYLGQLAGKPVYVGMQAEGREWVRLFSPKMIAKFDYVFTDSMTWRDHKGRRMRLWMPNEVYIESKQQFMDMLVEKAVSIISREPIDIYVNPTFLPERLAGEYDALWTEERMAKVINAAVENDVAIEINSRFRLPSVKFVRMAKKAGAKFAFGTNNGGRELGELEYSLKVAQECGLTARDMFVPKPDGEKPIQRRERDRTTAFRAAEAVGAETSWPQWGCRLGRNMVSGTTGLPESFVPGKKRPSGGGIDPSTTKNVKWATKLGSQTYGNPTVAGGMVFVGTDDASVSQDPRFKRTRGGLLQCLEETTGKVLWQFISPRRKNLPKDIHFGHQWLGVCSSPVVDGDRVYAITSGGDLVCLDADGMTDGNDGPFKDEAAFLASAVKGTLDLRDTDADIIWLYDMIKELGVYPHDAASCSALVLGDLVYVGTSNGVDGPHKKVLAPEAPSLVVLDKRTGRLVATDGEKIGRRMWHAQWASPSAGMVNGRTLIFFGGGDGICYAFDALTTVPERPITLKKVWSYDCNPPEYRYKNGKPIPYYDGDKRKKRGNDNDGKYVGPSQIIATPVFVNNRIYVAIGQDPAHGRGKGLLHCIDATKTGDITKTGKIWSYDGLDRTISTVAVSDGLVYCPDIAGKLHCLDADSGACYWTYETKSEIWSSPLVADGKVYLGSKKNFWVFAAGKEPRKLSSLRLGAPIYTTPVVAKGVMYVASQMYLWAVRADS